LARWGGIQTNGGDRELLSKGSCKFRDPEAQSSMLMKPLLLLEPTWSMVRGELVEPGYSRVPRAPHFYVEDIFQNCHECLK
jgi:hypothetical protein